MAASTKRRGATRRKRVGAKPAAGKQPLHGDSADDSDECIKNVKLADALREEGIGVRKIAQGYASLHGKLSDSEDKGDLKLFFDVLKENHRTLEPPRPADRDSENVTVILKHNVPRPAR